MPQELATSAPPADPAADPPGAGAGGAAPGSLLPTVLMLGGVLLLVWLALRGTIRRARAAPEPDPADDRLRAIRMAAREREEVGSVMADAEELTRRLAAALDAKAARIEMLLREADDRIARLERARGGVRAGAGRDHDEPAADPVSRRIYELADRGASAVEIARELSQPIG